MSARDEQLRYVQAATADLARARHAQWAAVAGARAEHAPWSLIGQALGMTTSGAHRKFIGRPCPDPACLAGHTPIY